LSTEVRLGSISADPVVDLDGRKQSASLSGAEADLHGRRSRPVAAGGDRRLPGILNGRLLAPTIGSKLLRQFWIELAAFLRIA